MEILAVKIRQLLLSCEFNNALLFVWHVLTFFLFVYCIV